MRIEDAIKTRRETRLACPEGLEPPTYSLEGYCSIRLSYGQMGRSGAQRRAVCSDHNRGCTIGSEGTLACWPKLDQILFHP